MRRRPRAASTVSRQMRRMRMGQWACLPNSSQQHVALGKQCPRHPDSARAQHREVHPPRGLAGGTANGGTKAVQLLQHVVTVVGEAHVTGRHALQLHAGSRRRALEVPVDGGFVTEHHRPQQRLDLVRLRVGVPEPLRSCNVGCEIRKIRDWLEEGNCPGLGRLGAGLPRRSTASMWPRAGVPERVCCS